MGAAALQPDVMPSEYILYSVLSCALPRCAVLHGESPKRLAPPLRCVVGMG